MSGLVQMLGLPFLACLLLGGILSYLGLHVLKREVIFLDIAMAQFAALGTVVAHVAFGVHADSWMAWTASLGATLLAALLFALARRRVARLHIEAVIGISYAVAAAATLLVIGKGAGGHTHIQDMLAGSILWTTWRDLLECSVAFAVAGLCFFLFRRPFQALSHDYARTTKDGTDGMGWDFLFYALCGVVITVAVGLAGVTVVFTFLIIPAVISAFFSVNWGTRFAVAWGCGAVASAGGLVFGYTLDFSAGSSVALLLGVILVGVAVVPAERRPRLMRMKEKES